MTALTIRPLIDVVRELAADPTLPGLLDPSARDRQWVELPVDGDYQAWLIAWPAGTGTGWHDHGIAAGGFTVLEGRLNEYTWNGARHVSTLAAGRSRVFPPGHIHDMQNVGTERALSVHVYTPRLTAMSRYAVRSGRLALAGVTTEGEDW